MEEDRHLVKTWIAGTLSEKVLGHAIGTETSRNLWEVFNKAHSQACMVREFSLPTLVLGPAYVAFATTMLKPAIPSYADVVPSLQSHELQVLNPTVAFVSSTHTKNQRRVDINSFNSSGKGFTQSVQSTPINHNEAKKGDSPGNNREGNP
ncbi:hypothetical protein CFOL_v3_05387 [Cephalotus follicularis]|uniref:UBN2_3 domain-containing protein n=1 Tax=Cephalotus follicularis TaxID=3775 RepID=A0A1Q3B1H4_CEPFO|nr:hypothetical protein CFOL_v3_05387 [Cephalotus follicularis]